MNILKQIWPKLVLDQNWSDTSMSQSCPWISVSFLQHAYQYMLCILTFKRIFELTHEIMALIALLKLNLQTCMRSHPMRLHVWFSVRSCVYYTLCVRIAKAVARLCGCAGSPEPSLVAYVMSTIISWAGSFNLTVASLKVLLEHYIMACT